MKFKAKVIEKDGEQLFQLHENGDNTLFDQVKIHWADSPITLTRNEIKLKNAIRIKTVGTHGSYNCFFCLKHEFKKHGLNAPSLTKNSEALKATYLEAGDTLEINRYGNSTITTKEYLTREYADAATSRVNAEYGKTMSFNELKKHVTANEANRQKYHDDVKQEKNKPAPEVLRFNIPA